MKDKKNIIIKYIVVAIIIIIGVAADQVTKRILNSLSSLRDGIVVIKNFFILRIAHNTGVAWSKFEGNFFVLYIIPLIALAIFIFLLIKSDYKKMKLYTIGIALMIAGTIGNYIDRVSLRYVIDFLEFHFGSYQYPTFNLADSMLVIGVIFFSIDVLFLDSRRLNKEKSNDESTETES